MARLLIALLLCGAEAFRFPWQRKSNFDADFDADPEIRKAVIVLTRGYKINDKAVIPLDGHSSKVELFDASKLRTYTRDSFLPAPDSHINKIEAATVREFASEMESEVGLSGETKAWGGATVSGSVSAELDLSSTGKESRFYVQHRKIYKFGSLIMPGTVKKIQHLMVPETLKELKAVSNAKKAENMLAATGLFYVDRATFGLVATYTYVGSKQEYGNAKKVSAAMTAAVKAPMAWKAGASGSLAINKSEGSETSSSQITVRTYGGNPLKAENEASWGETASQNPVVIKYSLSPVHELLDPSTDAYKLLKQEFENQLGARQDELKELGQTHDLMPTKPPLPAGTYWVSSRGAWYLEATKNKQNQVEQWSTPQNTWLKVAPTKDGSSTGGGSTTLQWIVEVVDELDATQITLRTRYADSKTWKRYIFAGTDALDRTNGGWIGMMQGEAKWLVEDLVEKDGVYLCALKSDETGFYLNSWEKKVQQWSYKQKWTFTPVE